MRICAICIRINLFTYLLPPCSTALLEKLTDFQQIKKFPTFYGTRNFIIAVTSARHLSLSWASSIQSILPHPISWRSILILSPHLRLVVPSGLFPSGFPTKTMYTPILSLIRATYPAHLILLDFFTLTILGVKKCRLSAISYSVYPQLPSILEAVPPSLAWGRVMQWLEGHIYRGHTKYTKCIWQHEYTTCVLLHATWKRV